MSAGHPEKQILADYASGQLSEELATAVAEHLDNCPECEAAIDSLNRVSGAWLSSICQTYTPDPIVHESEYQRAVSNIERLSRSSLSGEVQPLAGGFDDSAAPNPDRMSANTPSQLGPYRLLEKVGEGGMGAVFKAQHEHLGKIVAIKILPAKSLQDPAAVVRFQREMKAIGALHHPNIVVAYDAGESAGIHFLAMEYVDGQDLSTRVKTSGAVSIPQAVSYIRQAAAGLACAHAKGIVHRDIKPANLLVDSSGIVKILDLGLARLDDPTAQQQPSELTHAGQLMGTTDYMAPEQALDTRRADAKADIYSLGCTLYRILTGRNAFEAETDVQKIVAHREQSPPSLRKSRPDIPAELESLYQRMMSKRPENRPSAEELVRALGRLEAQLNSEPSAFQRIHRDARRLAFAIVIATAACLLAGWIALSQVGGDQNANVSIDQPKSKQSAAAGDLPAVEETPFTSRDERGPAKAEPVATTRPGSNFALRFDGQNDHVRIFSLFDEGSGPLTLEAWIQPTEPPQNFGTIVGNENSNAGAALRYIKADVTFQREQSGMIWWVSARAPFGASKPMHVAGVRDGESLRVFVDGKLASAYVTTSKTSGQDRPQRSFTIGSAGGGLTNFIGVIDEVRISKVARYAKEFTPQQRFEPDEGTIALYHFDEAQGDVLTDSSDNGHHGKIIGAKWVRVDGSAIASRATLDLAGQAPSAAICPFDALAAKRHQAAWAAHLGTTVETANSVDAKLVLIPPGEFLMGSTLEQIATVEKAAAMSRDLQIPRLRSESPQHRVVLTRPFVMWATEVTIAQYGRFVDATKYATEPEKLGGGQTTRDGKTVYDPAITWKNPRYMPQSQPQDNSAVAQLTWGDCVAFCNWLSEQEKLPKAYEQQADGTWRALTMAGYRLPTEAEWEFACRAGTTTLFSFGDDVQQQEDFVWHSQNYPKNPNALVGLKQPNPFGLFDMHGHMYEYCNDFFSNDSYENAKSSDPTGASPRNQHVIRSGNGATSSIVCLRSASRAAAALAARYNNYGFRPVRSLGQPVTASAGSTSAVFPGSSVDVLAAIDPVRDSIEGSWERDGNALRTPPEINNQQRQRLYLPVPGKLPEEYDLSLKLARVGETPNGWEALNIGLVSGDVKATFYIYGGSNSLELGLANIDGKPANENGTRKRISDWPLNKPVTIQLQVRRPEKTFAVRGLLDGKEVWSWQGDPKLLTRTWTAPDPKKLFLGSTLACRIDALALTPISSAAGK